MGERYRKQVTGLIDALNEPDRRTEAAELIRTLVDHIVFAPEEGSPKRATLDLHGDLAGILGLVSETGGKPPVTTLVAGAGFEPATLLPIPPTGARKRDPLSIELRHAAKLWSGDDLHSGEGTFLVSGKSV